MLNLYRNPLLKSTFIKAIILLSISLLIAVILGVVLSSINNMDEIDNLLDTKKSALPSVLYDRNGDVITTFYSDEKRDLISLNSVPDYLVKGLIVYEDESFYHHRGFNGLAILRAALNDLIGRPVSGASTLTQQLARTIFLTHKFSWSRKIKEFWISLQLEKKFTKNEILTLYINHVPLGYGINGFQAGARFYFNKDVSDLTYAEAASLITLISNPTRYSFISQPENHKRKQKEVLKKMVKAGILTEEEAEKSLNEFWLKWEMTPQQSRGAFFNREDKAPFFSDWVLNEISNELPNVNVFKDGLRIYSTLDLKYNKLVDTMMNDVLDRQQKIFEASSSIQYNAIQKNYLDMVSIVSDVFSLDGINFNRNKNNIERAQTEVNKDIMPALNLTAQTLGIGSLDVMSEMLMDKETSTQKLLAQVEGAFIALDNDTGQIIAMYGGRNFDPNNRFNYAMQARKQPGSSFKPLYYSAAFDTKMFTPATVIVDKPRVFTMGSDDPADWYSPYNYGGLYYGPVTLRKALRRSLNIPSCVIFYEIGKNNNYRVPIDRAALLLGINSQDEINKRFAPTVSTALGTCTVSPIEMATAYSVFANMGKKRIPNTIIKVEDANGKPIWEPWKELEKYYRENNRRLQIINPQTAYLITSILEDTFNNDGILVGLKQRMIEEHKRIPPVDFAAKTGTTQNWSDIWTISYSPVITAAGWIGFDKSGLSLGIGQSGGATIAPVVMEFMRQYHENMGPTQFKRPDGIQTAVVCKYSGLLPSPYCDKDDLYTEYFLPGTVPTEVDTYCKSLKLREEKSNQFIMDKYEKDFSNQDLNKFFKDKSINVDKSILNEFKSNDNTKIDDSQLNKINLFEDFKDVKDPTINGQSSSTASSTSPGTESVSESSSEQSSVPAVDQNSSGTQTQSSSSSSGSTD